MDAAAADSLRKDVGTAQNAGWNTKEQARTNVNPASQNQRAERKRKASDSADPVSKTRIGECKSGQGLKSEFQPSHCCEKTPREEGSGGNIVSATSLCPDRRFRIV